MTPPHIVYVLDDQHRYCALGSSGNPIVLTPNLDRLAGEGMVLDQVFSSCPICAPHRAQLFTGRYSHCNGVPDNEYRMRADQTTLPQALKRAGYHTGLIGKWHLGYPPYTEESRHGFDYMAANNAEHDYYRGSYFENERGPISIDGWAPEEETTLAIRFLEAHQRTQPGRPLFLVLSFGPPHWPYDQYPSAFDIYDPAAIELRPNVPERMADFTRWELAQYYASISALDAQIGRLMSALDRLHLAENTLVVFTSDHGDHLGSHGYSKELDAGPDVPYWPGPPLHHSLYASKATPYEESIHVPFIARLPGRVPAGQRSSVLMSSVDIMPTLLGLCGVEVPPGAQGRSLSHVLLGEEGPLPDSVYLQILGPGWPHRGPWVGFWRGVRTERWTYARWHKNEYGPLLFDRDRDPFEMNNLAGKAAFTDIKNHLEQRLRRWMNETGDPFDHGPRNPDTGMLELGQEFSHEMYLRPAGSTD